MRAFERACTSVRCWLYIHNHMACFDLSLGQDKQSKICIGLTLGPPKSRRFNLFVFICSPSAHLLLTPTTSLRGWPNVFMFHYLLICPLASIATILLFVLPDSPQNSSPPMIQLWIIDVSVWLCSPDWITFIYLSLFPPRIDLKMSFLFKRLGTDAEFEILSSKGRSNSSTTLSSLVSGSTSITLSRPMKWRRNQRSDPWIWYIVSINTRWHSYPC